MAPGSIIRSLEKDLLPRSADLVARKAGILCRGGLSGSRDCDWYHGTWQYLRILDLVSSPTWHDEFYRFAIERVLKRSREPARILISGAADYSMPLYVVMIAEAVPRLVEITVVDLCPTPLFSCGWLSKRLSHDFRLVRGDVRSVDLGGPARFDLICTDAFLTRFEKDETAEVLSAWEDLLDDHGHVITTARLTEIELGGMGRQIYAEKLIKSAHERWQETHAGSKPAFSELSRRLDIYAKRVRSTPLGPAQDVADLLRTTFSIRHLEVADVPDPLRPTQYLRVVMRKRE